METVLKVDNVTKKYKAQHALDHVSLDIHKGEIYGLIGRNGAGKTTLLKTISRLISPTEGNVRLFGSVTSSDWTEALKRTGSVIETPVAYDQMTAVQNLAYYCTLRGIVDKENVIRDTLELVGLADTDKKKFKNFSLGMKQKLGIAIAILSKPDLLILDEPINGLDPIAIVEFRQLMKRLNEERNMTIIISSHILTELYHVATRFGFLNDGVLVKEISKTDFDELSEAYIVLNTSAMSEASRILQEEMNYKLKVVGQNELNIFSQSHEINRIVQRLVAAGIPIDGIYYQKEELEAYFTDLVSHEEEVPC